MEKAKRRGGESLCLSSRDRKVAVTFPTVARATPKARKATRSAETGKNAPGQRRAGSGTLFGASMFGAGIGWNSRRPHDTLQLPHERRWERDRQARAYRRRQKPGPKGGEKVACPLFPPFFPKFDSKANIDSTYAEMEAVDASVMADIAAMKMRDWNCGDTCGWLFH